MNKQCASPRAVNGSFRSRYNIFQPSVLKAELKQGFSYKQVARRLGACPRYTLRLMMEMPTLIDPAPRYLDYLRGEESPTRLRALCLPWTLDAPISPLLKLHRELHPITYHACLREPY